MGCQIQAHFPTLNPFFGFEQSGKGLRFRSRNSYGHVDKCKARGIVEINMIADDGPPLKAHLHGVIYVPGLKRRLFSITVFAIRGYYAIVRKNEIQLIFGQEERPLTLMLKNGMPLPTMLL
jgi:hypothetical protein